MREYNNRDIKINESELDPCIAAEVRMKKALFSRRTRRIILIALALLILIALVVAVALLISTRSSKRRQNELLRQEPEDYHLMDNTPVIPSDVIAIWDDISTKPITIGYMEVTESEQSLREIKTTTAVTHELNEPKQHDMRIFTTINDDSDIKWTESASISSTSAPENVSAISTQAEVKINEETTKLPTTNMTNIFFGTLDVRITQPISFFVSDHNLTEDCHSIMEQGNNESGIYQVVSQKIGKFEVLCDMETSGGGWTIIQKRTDGAIYFSNRTWNEYEDGFGNMTSSFWLGLKKIFSLVNKKPVRPVILRIELRGDLCQEMKGCSNDPNGFWWGEWQFKLGGADQEYKLMISHAIAGNLSGHSISDKFYYMNNGQKFTTIDRDNDKLNGNCAQFRDFGGWWHNDCSFVALNGRYGDDSAKMRNMFWFFTNGLRPYISYYIKPRQSIMMIRPDNVTQIVA